MVTDRKLTDHTVRQALESLVRRLRAVPLPPLTDPGKFEHEAGHEAELFVGDPPALGDAA